MSNIKEIKCDADDIRIDSYISEKMDDMSRSYAQKLIAGNMVLVNGIPVKAKYKIQEGDIISIEIPKVQILKAVPENIPVEILYEDEYLVVVNKARGMVVHPAPGNHSGTLVNALMYHCKGRLSSISGIERPGIVHRIDKDTSGILVVAKTDSAHRELVRMFADHDIDREYIAAVWGVVSENGARIEAPVGRHPNDRKRMSVNTKNGKNAVTHFTVMERYRKTTLIKAKLETGRTHQIRVHMAYIGHPLIGDGVYGRGKKNYQISGQALHAAKLGFRHPVTGEAMEFEKEPPEVFMKLIRELKDE